MLRVRFPSGGSWTCLLSLNSKSLGCIVSLSKRSSAIWYSWGPFTLRSIWDRSQFALRKCSHSFKSILDRSQFAFERSHSDRFGLRSISDRSNSLVWMAPWISLSSYRAWSGTFWSYIVSNNLCSGLYT